MAQTLHTIHGRGCKGNLINQPSNQDRQTALRVQTLQENLIKNELRMNEQVKKAQVSMEKSGHALSISRAKLAQHEQDKTTVQAPGDSAPEPSLDQSTVSAGTGLD